MVGNVARQKAWMSRIAALSGSSYGCGVRLPSDCNTTGEPGAVVAGVVVAGSVLAGAVLAVGGDVGVVVGRGCGLAATTSIEASQPARTRSTAPTGAARHDRPRLRVRIAVTIGRRPFIGTGPRRGRRGAWRRSGDPAETRRS